MTANDDGKGTSANNYLDSKFILNSNETLNGLGYGDYVEEVFRACLFCKSWIFQ